MHDAKSPALAQIIILSGGCKITKGRKQCSRTAWTSPSRRLRRTRSWVEFRCCACSDLPTVLII